MKRSNSNIIVCGMCTLLIFACTSCRDSVNYESKSNNNLSPTPAPTTSMSATSKSTPTDSGAIAEPPTSQATPKVIKQKLDRITELLNMTETQVKQEAMSSREKEEDKTIRRILGPTRSDRERMFEKWSYRVFTLDNGKLEILISGDLAIRTIETDMGNLDADKVNAARESIIIPCKAGSGKCADENIRSAKKGETEYSKSARLTIKLTNFTNNDIRAELVELFSHVIKLSQARPN